MFRIVFLRVRIEVWIGAFGRAHDAMECWALGTGGRGVAPMAVCWAGKWGGRAADQCVLSLGGCLWVRFDRFGAQWWRLWPEAAVRLLPAGVGLQQNRCLALLIRIWAVRCGGRNEEASVEKCCDLIGRFCSEAERQPSRDERGPESFRPPMNAPAPQHSMTHGTKQSARKATRQQRG